MMERTVAIVLALLLAGSATPSTRLPVTTNTDVNAAKRTVATTNLPTPRYVNDHDAMRRIARVTARLTPAANSTCRYLAEDECQWDVQYSSDSEFNAYASGESDSVINNGIISVARNDDELALVIAHEMSHHIADHLSEMQQNAAVGALFMGLLGAYSARNNYYNPQARQQMIEDSVNLGGWQLTQGPARAEDRPHEPIVGVDAHTAMPL